MPDSRLITDLHPAFQPRVQRWLAACEARGLPLKVIATMRPMIVSRAYYARGRESLTVVNGLYRAAGLGTITALDNQSTITNATPGKSWHNHGLAVDFVPLLADGRLDWTYNPSDPTDHYDEIELLAEAEGLLWGGDWRTFKDYPHVEWHPGFTTATALAWMEQQGWDKQGRVWLPLLPPLVPPVTPPATAPRYVLDKTKQYSEGSVMDLVTGKSVMLSEIIKLLNEG